MSLLGNRWTEPNYQKAIEWCKTRQKQDINCTVAFLGGTPQDDSQAQLAFETNVYVVKLIGDQKLNASVTLKPTVLGVLLDKSKCRQRVLAIAEEAANQNLPVEIATESKDLVSFSLETAVACAKENKNVILDLQVYLNRTFEDLKTASKNGAGVRLVKGAYVGDANKLEEIQTHFKSLIDSSAVNSNKVLLGTHDPEIIEWVKEKFRDKKGLVEFGFLKGLSDRTKIELVERGWRVLEYVPFGEKTGAYVNRRLKFLSDLEAIGKLPAP